MKTRLKYSILIIILILIFLGILWLKYTSSNKEGLDAASTAALSTDIINTVNDKLSAAGVDTVDYTSKIPGFIQQITDIVEQEASIIGAADAGAAVAGAGPPDLSNVIDTTGGDYYPNKTYFKGSKFSDGFCQSHPDPVELNNACSSLTTENCNQTDCCIVLNGSKCVAGNDQGPTYQTENGKDIDYAYYSYKNQCYGSCGKGLANAANPCAAYSDTDTGLSEQCLKRLWSQAGCPNGAYINSEVVTAFKDYSKAAVVVKFKSARSDEPNYDKCYGPNQSRWPVPCNATTDTSINLSARCLTRLFTEVGCTNTDTITDAYATANNLESKSAMINVFTDLTDAEDDSDGKLTKCYGSDELYWPDPCLGVSDTASLLTGTLPKRCAGKVFKEATNCPSTDYVTYMNNNIASMTTSAKNALISSSASQYTKAGLAALWSSQEVDIQNNRFKCYGMNTNNWQNMGINIKTPDPCGSNRPGTKASDVPGACFARLRGSNGSDIFPTTGCSKGNAVKVTAMSGQQLSISGGHKYMFEQLMAEESVYNKNMNKFCGPTKEYLLGIGLDNQPWLKPTSDLTKIWVRYYQNSGGVRTLIQIQDGTFLAIGGDSRVYTKDSIDTEDKYTLVNDHCCVASVIQLNDGTFVFSGTDGYLWQKAKLTDAWKQIPGSSWVASITLINGGQTIAGIGGNNVVYTRPASITQQTWTQVPGTAAIKSLTQLKDGTFVGVGMNNELYTRPTLADANWTQIPNSGAVTFISTVNVYMSEFDGPDPQAVGSLHGWAIKNNNGSIPVLKAKYLNDGQTIVYIAYDGGYTKMVTNKGIAKYYSGPVDNFHSNNWDTYSNAGNGYIYSPS